MLRYAFLALVLVLFIPNVSQASGSHRGRHAVRDANGNIAHSLVTIRSRKTGATARVDAQYASEFQSYVDDLEGRGAVIRFMGGFRRGRGGGAARRPCGRARGGGRRARGRGGAGGRRPRPAARAAGAGGRGRGE